MRTKVLVAAALAVGILGSFADPSLVPGLVPAPAWAQAKGSMPGVTRTSGGRMSIDVQGADIKTVLRSLSEFSGKNIVVGKDVKGQVSISLKDVT